MKKPRLSVSQIINMSFGFIGIQFGWSLQMGNMSPIYKFLGASDEELALLWLAAPVTGLVVQPIIGYFSDRTWFMNSRRRPYFLVGAILASIALILMPNSPTVWFAAGLLWILDASINVSMEPFRAFVGDKLPEEQQGKGYTVQSLFIGFASVLAFMLPSILSNFSAFDDPEGYSGVPTNVKWSFYFGAFAFIAAVLYTIFTTKEYPPTKEALKELEEEKSQPGHWGPFQFLKDIPKGIATMPKLMRQLAPVQLFTWLGLFLMWIYFITTTTQTVFHAKDYPQAYGWLNEALAKEDNLSVIEANYQDFFEERHWDKIKEDYGSLTALSTEGYDKFGGKEAFKTEITENSAKQKAGGEWGGNMFALYSLVTFLFGFALAWMDGRFKPKWIHMGCLIVGGIGLASTFFVTGKWGLIIPMIGIGIAWASILSVPYTMLARILPTKKMGFYMGVFNFFIVIPEIIASLVFKDVLKSALGGNTVWALVIGGVSMVIAGLLMFLVKEPTPEEIPAE